MPSKQRDNRAYKRLKVQLKKYRTQKESPEKTNAGGNNLNKSSHYSCSDHEENQDRSHDHDEDGKISLKKNQTDIGDLTSNNVTMEDIKNLVLASYRSLSRQISNLSDQIEDSSSRLSTLESLVKSNEKSEENITEGPIVEAKVPVTLGSINKNNENEEDDEIFIIKDSESESDSGSGSDSDFDSDSDSDSEEEEKKSMKVVDTSIRLKFPLETENDFYRFNAKISKPQYRRRLIRDLTKLLNNDKLEGMTTNIHKMIRHYLTKNVAIKYNTKTSTKKKKAFIDTLFYECIEEVVKNMYGKSKTLSNRQIHESMSTALKSARYWKERTTRRSKVK